MLRAMQQRARSMATALSPIHDATRRTMAWHLLSSPEPALHRRASGTCANCRTGPGANPMTAPSRSPDGGRAAEQAAVVLVGEQHLRRAGVEPPHLADPGVGLEG